jgi:hypothetical protein
VARGSRASGSRTSRNGSRGFCFLITRGRGHELNDQGFPQVPG